MFHSHQVLPKKDSLKVAMHGLGDLRTSVPGVPFLPGGPAVPFIPCKHVTHTARIRALVASMQMA